ncbi:MAG TPA: hypothetical protein VI322_04730 [Candidatus Saccharimonadia bacterium]
MTDEEIGLPGTVENLRSILNDQFGREVSQDEAGEVGHALIEFYETLAREADDEPAE